MRSHRLRPVGRCEEVVVGDDSHHAALGGAAVGANLTLGWEELVVCK